ncbi:hypothetical protein BDR07DRAFT_1424269 [Suillus spraguei]|nr:hypothetical protein BDR07DRAFT_1424269 [Suillus spraguei]
MTMRDLWYHNKSALTLGTHIVCTLPTQLLPNLVSTPWKVLYDSQHDRAFITTMGVDVPPSPHYLLQALRKPVTVQRERAKPKGREYNGAGLILTVQEEVFTDRT